jgi:hypothetical protein
MNKVTKYKLKYMMKGSLKIAGYTLGILGIACLDVYLAYITIITLGEKDVVVTTGVLSGLYMLLTALIFIPSISAIQTTWKSIKVPAIITDEKAKKQVGNLSIVKHTLAK